MCRSSIFLGARLFLSVSSASPLSSVTRAMCSTKRDFERLPSNVTPKNYQLTLQPNLTEFTFTGKEVVDVEVSVSILFISVTGI